jgi:hypothetical protein
VCCNKERLCLKKNDISELSYTCLINVVYNYQYHILQSLNFVFPTKKKHQHFGSTITFCLVLIFNLPHSSVQMGASMFLRRKYAPCKEYLFHLNNLHNVHLEKSNNLLVTCMYSCPYHSPIIYYHVLQYVYLWSFCIGQLPVDPYSHKLTRSYSS